MSSSSVCRALLDTSLFDGPNDSDDSFNFASSLDSDTNQDPELDLDNSMPLPPEDFYTTKKELFSAIQDWSKGYNYAFRRRRRKKLTDTREKVYYECTCGGPRPIMDRPKNDPRRPQDRIRSTSSKKTGCEFSVCGVQVDSHHWEVRHRPDAKFGVHNHPQSSSALEHAVHRRLNPAQIEKARELHSIGTFRCLQLY